MLQLHLNSPLCPFASSISGVAGMMPDFCLGMPRIKIVQDTGSVRPVPMKEPDTATNNHALYRNQMIERMQDCQMRLGEWPS